MPKPKKPMSQRVSARTRREGRRCKVADMYLRCMSHREIAAELKVNHATIGNDLKVIRKEWRTSAVDDIHEQLTLELEKLQLVEKTAWDGWLSSSRITITSHERKESTGR